MSEPKGQRFRRIATEEAFATPELFRLYEKIAQAGSANLDISVLTMQLRDPLGARLLDMETQRLADMDQAGVDMQIVALTSPGVQIFDADTACDVAATANDQLASAIARHPTRYAGLGAFAPQDPRRAVKEMERAVHELKLNGFVVHSNTDGLYLDNEKFWPILEAAEALERPLYIHPRAPSEPMADPYRLSVIWGAMWGYQADVSINIVRMIAARTFDRFPRLKVVIGHMGENIPSHLWRLDHWWRPKDGAKFSDIFRRNVSITTSGAYPHPVADEALKLTINAVGAENILWAVDYPWQLSPPATQWMDELDIDVRQKAMIYHRNAERIFHIAPTPALSMARSVA